MYWMRILLSSQLVVALTLFLIGFVSSESELSNSLTIPTSSETPTDKPLLPTKLSSVQYESACVSIYDSGTISNSKKIYFYSPIALLNHTSVDSVFNQTSSQGLISYSFSIWNEDLGIKVAQHLTRILNQQIEPNQVQVFPFKSLTLINAEQSSVDFLLTNDWLTYNNEQSLTFSVTCSTQDDCDRMTTQMRGNSKKFKHLRLDSNPQLNDTCFNDGVKISQEDLSMQVEDLLKSFLEEAKLNFIEELKRMKQELLANIETKLAKELNAIKEGVWISETSRRMKSESTLTVNRFSSILVEYAEISAAESQFAMENLKMELQETKKDLAASSQKFTDKIKLTEKNLAAALINLKTTRNELTQTKATVGELSTKLNETQQQLEITKANLQKIRTDLSNTVDDLSIKLNKTKQELVEIISANVRNLSTEFKSTNAILSDLTTKFNVTKTELEATKTALNSTRNELANRKSSFNNLTTKLNVTKFELEAAKTAINSIRNELVNTKSNVTNLTTKLNARTSEIVDIGQMPTSCDDLQRMGHKLSGLFSVKGSKKVEMVYCNFSNGNGNDKQKWIGYSDVKSAIVHFYVQRNSPFTKKSTKIPFDLARVNVGNAMNLTSGIFTAPRPGIYFFSFTGLVAFPASSSPSYVKLEVGLFLNGNQIGMGFVEEANTVDFQLNPLSLQSTLNLKKGDQIWVEITDLTPKVYLFDDSGHYTHLTGSMLEEEIGASL